MVSPLILRKIYNGQGEMGNWIMPRGHKIWGFLAFFYIKEFERFDLKRFEKLYLKNVRAYTEREFEEEFLAKLS